MSATATVGGANPTARQVVITNGGGGTLGGLAVGAIGYGAGQPTGWLQASLNQSAAPATLTMLATTGALPAGTYTATVPITSPTAGNSPQTVTYTFTVGQSPTIALSPASLVYTAQAGAGNPASQTVAVTNGGNGALDGLSVGAIVYGAGQPTGWLGATLGGTTAPATLTVSAATGALPAGTYTATIPIASSAAGVTNSPQSVSVTFTVTAAPVIALAPGALTFNAQQGGASPAPQPVAVTNAGGGTLAGLAVGPIAYGGGQPTGWLAATLSGPSAPATLSVQPNVGALAAGTYTATVPVTAAGVGNSPQSVQVTLVVAPPAASIALSKNPVLISIQTNALSTRSAAVNVTNGGSGALTGVALGAVSYQGAGSGWLTAALSGATAPAIITLRGSSRNLTSQLYQATVDVTSSMPGVAKQTLQVQMEVVDIKLYEQALTNAALLTPAERARLDALGNANSTYDLGDYLALRARLGLP